MYDVHDSMYVGFDLEDDLMDMDIGTTYSL